MAVTVGQYGSDTFDPILKRIQAPRLLSWSDRNLRLLFKLSDLSTLVNLKSQICWLSSLRARSELEKSRGQKAEGRIWEPKKKSCFVIASFYLILPSSYYLLTENKMVYSLPGARGGGIIHDELTDCVWVSHFHKLLELLLGFSCLHNRLSAGNLQKG